MFNIFMSVFVSHFRIFRSYHRGPNGSAEVVFHGVDGSALNISVNWLVLKSYSRAVQFVRVVHYHYFVFASMLIKL